MTATTSAQTFVSFFSPDLLATRDPATAHVCGQTWQGKLEMGLHAAAQLAENLRSEMSEGSPHHETIIALYTRLLSLSTAHPVRENSRGEGKEVVAPENLLGQPLARATETVAAWYLDSINSKHFSARGNQESPTSETVTSVCDTLSSLLSLDLSAAARPHIERYNSSCKPGQVFTTPLELFRPGGPLEWQTGQNTRVA